MQQLWVQQEATMLLPLLLQMGQAQLHSAVRSAATPV
jgi:hypothetical protein